MDSPRVRIVAANEGARYDVFGSTILYKATAADTGGTFSLAVETTPPRGGFPLHVHHREDEVMFILEGEFEIESDGEISRVGPGTFVLLPRDVPNGYRNVGDGPGRFVHLTVPGGFEDVVRETSRALAEGGQDPQRMKAIGSAHGIEFV